MSNNIKNKQVDAIFYIAYPYYFPHLLPVHEYFLQAGKTTLFILSTQQNTPLMEQIAQQEGIDYVLGDEKLFELQAEFFFFANHIKSTQGIKGHTVFMDHGVGTKACDYQSACELFDTVLIEGQYRDTMLKNELPQYQHKIHCVGFTKLDPMVNLSAEQKAITLQSYGLDPNKSTILYAPTFFPSSIEKMSKQFTHDFAQCNVIIKPHYLSLERRKYKAQQQRFALWQQSKNCYVADVSQYNLTHFINLADVMISDESSAIFECVALNKPVVINRFLKLRLSYYLNPKKLLKRMDQGIEVYRKVGYNPKTYANMLKDVRMALADPNEHQSLRTEVTDSICGQVDGLVSKRIYNLLYKKADNEPR